MITYFLFIIGFILLIKGANMLVDGAASIAKKMNVSSIVVGLTIVAFGTSLPELATSAVAAYKKQSDIAIGNVVGSNIFKIFRI
jgi:cation:H+ antiporter